MLLLLLLFLVFVDDGFAIAAGECDRPMSSAITRMPPVIDWRNKTNKWILIFALAVPFFLLPIPFLIQYSNKKLLFFYFADLAKTIRRFAGRVFGVCAATFKVVVVVVVAVVVVVVVVGAAARPKPNS